MGADRGVPDLEGSRGGGGAAALNLEVKKSHSPNQQVWEGTWGWAQLGRGRKKILSGCFAKGRICHERKKGWGGGGTFQKTRLKKGKRGNYVSCYIQNKKTPLRFSRRREWQGDDAAIGRQ